MQILLIHSIRILLIFSISLTHTVAAQAIDNTDYIWWEAEDFTSGSGAYSERHDLLSGNEWIHVNNVGPGKERFLEYSNISIPESGQYHLYARKFWKHGPYQWVIDQASKKIVVNSDVPLLDSSYLRPFTEANWTYAGSVNLTAGNHQLRIDLLESEGGAAFDAFVFTRESFPFRGKYQPDEFINVDTPGWFTWHANVDHFQESPMDLRFLNEDIAGSKGFIIPKEEDFIHQDTGEIVRFWGVNAGPDVFRMDELSAKRYARDLAKYGVNLVRIYGPLFEGHGPDFHSFNAEYLDDLFRFISILKSEGIYSTLSIYFPIWLTLGPNDPEFLGYNGDYPFSILFYDPVFQNHYRSWLEKIVTTVNPYTSIALKDEKAILSLEMVNEDSLLFWTFTTEGIPGQNLKILEAQFASYLVEKYGSLNSLRESWGGFNRSLDHPDEHRIGFLHLYELISNPSQRAKDTALFLTNKQKAFFQFHYNYLKNTLGFKSMVSASNWITASDTILGPLDKYSNTVADFMDQHGYFEPYHKDNGDSSSSYSVREEHLYQNRSSLLFMSPQSLDTSFFSNPIMSTVYNNKPSMISEINWPRPNRFRTEMAVIIAAYGRLQGLDAIVNFESTPTPWSYQQSKFSINSPVVKGQWPLVALAFRKGLIQEGTATVEAIIPVNSHLGELSGSPISHASNPDNLRITNLLHERTEIDSNQWLHPLTFLTGKTNSKFVEDGEFSLTQQLAQDFDEQVQHKIIVSNTGELTWDINNGTIILNGQYLQGITGFLSKASPVITKNLLIDSGIEYGTILLLSLDNKEIHNSEKLMLMVMSEELPENWHSIQSDEYLKITNLGNFPYMVKNLEGSVEIIKEDIDEFKIFPLNQNGYIQQFSLYTKNIELDSKTTYYLISK